MCTGWYRYIYIFVLLLYSLASQAYGAGDVKQVGVVLQRGLIILNLTAIPIWVLWFNCERILLAVGQEAHTSKLAGDFVFYYSPGLPAMLSYEPLKKYLQVWTMSFSLLLLLSFVVILPFSSFKITYIHHNTSEWLSKLPFY